MAHNNPINIHTDDRTGITYALSISDPRFQEEALVKLKQRAEHDYIDSLPGEERAKRKLKDETFTCPHCHGHHSVSSRKVPITSGFLFVRTELIDVFTCPCGREFKQIELTRERDSVKRDNIVKRNFEIWRDADREGLNPPEFHSIEAIDKFVLTRDALSK